MSEVVVGRACRGPSVSGEASPPEADVDDNKLSVSGEASPPEYSEAIRVRDVLAPVLFLSCSCLVPVLCMHPNPEIRWTSGLLIS